MGNLVPFRKRIRAAKARKASPKPGNAEIVLFTGVRYQRGETALPDKPVATVRPRRRRG